MDPHQKQPHETGVFYAARFGPNDISLQLAQVTYDLHFLLPGFGSKCLCGETELIAMLGIIPQTGNRMPKPQHHCKIHP